LILTKSEDSAQRIQHRGSFVHMQRLTDVPQLVQHENVDGVCQPRFSMKIFSFVDCEVDVRDASSERQCDQNWTTGTYSYT
jgi:hypothetical protein